MNAFSDRPLSVEDRVRDAELALAAVDDAWLLVIVPSPEMEAAFAAVREAWVEPVEARLRGDDEAAAAGWDAVAERVDALARAVADHPAPTGPLVAAVADLRREAHGLGPRLRLDRRFDEIVDGLTSGH